MAMVIDVVMVIAVRRRCLRLLRNSGLKSGSFKNHDLSYKDVARPEVAAVNATPVSSGRWAPNLVEHLIGPEA